MQGKVLQPSTRAQDKSKKPKAKAKAKGGGKGRGKNAVAKGAPKAKADSNAQILPEPGKLEDAVMVDFEGHVISRTKYFLDCLLGGVRHALLSARATFGVPTGVAGVETSFELGTNREGQTVFYMKHELEILQKCIKLGLTFALRGEVEVNGKVLKRWSLCRPQIQQFAMNAVKAVSWIYKVQVMFPSRLC